MSYNKSSIPKVSIITPCYNSSSYITECIQSVLNQSFTNWEMIIIDDNSSDNTLDAISNVCSQDNRIKVFELENNVGPSKARNIGIDNSNGKFIAFLDSDDVWYPKKLETQVNFMNKNKYSFTYTYYDKIDENGISLGHVVKPASRLTYHELLKSNQIGCLTVMYDTQILGKMYMSEKGRDDYSLWLKILKKTGEAYCLKKVLSSYRVRPESVSDKKFKMLKFHYQLFREEENLSLPKTLYYLFYNVKRRALGNPNS